MTGIQLGLRRITKLLERPPNSWKAVHVAGTNGKGSVCNHTYNLLLASGIKCGMFTSPHLIDRWDCISINGSPISWALFDTVERRIKARNEALEIKASSFEILTATAFEAFTDSKVDVAVVEVGVGGLEDATNIIERPAVTVITKLGLDHEDILGKGIQNIVNHKAGIMKYPVPCLVDGTNSQDVLIMLAEKAKARSIKHFKICLPSHYALKTSVFSTIPDWSLLGLHKRMHLILAYESARIAIRVAKKVQPDWKAILPQISKQTLPGRQKSISIASLTGRLPHVLLDGCHNEQSAIALAQLIATKYRLNENNGICWVLAASGTKDIESMFTHLVKETDDVVITEFGPVDGMPWVLPMKAKDVVATLETLEEKPKSCTIASSVPEALQKATVLADKRPLVIAGSLYLVSDVLRLLRDHNSGIQQRNQ